MQSLTKSCAIDPIPTFLLKELVDPLLTNVTTMINASLREGYLPAEQKRAVVTPLLKKPGLDADEMRNYRPVSDLTLVSKLVERVVASRLVGYLNTHCLMPQLQSAYRRHHSTETALLKVLSYIYAAVDSQQVVLLGLLDLSAAFDCVDHEFYYVGYVSGLASAEQPMTGLRRFCTIVHSGYCIGDVCRQSGSCCLAFPRVQFWALYCSYCIRPNSSTVSQVTRMPTTRSTPATDHVDAMDRLATCI